MDGLTQVPVNHAIDLNFSQALRSILRQDPDVIMIGEIRDQENRRDCHQSRANRPLGFSQFAYKIGSPSRATLIEPWHRTRRDPAQR